MAVYGDEETINQGVAVGNGGGGRCSVEMIKWRLHQNNEYNGSRNLVSSLFSSSRTKNIVMMWVWCGEIWFFLNLHQRWVSLDSCDCISQKIYLRDFIYMTQVCLKTEKDLEWTEIFSSNSVSTPLDPNRSRNSVATPLDYEKFAI